VKFTLVSSRRLAFILAFLSAAAIDFAFALPPASVGQQQVAAVVGRDLKLDSSVVTGQLRVLAAVTLMPPDAELHVVSVKPGFASGTWLLRLRCNSPRQCLPFDAVLHAPGLSLPGLVPTFRPLNRETNLTGGRKANAPVLARSGEQVELVEDLSGMRLRARARCLQAGALGDHIRVLNLSSHRTVTATVAGEKLVRVEP